MIRAMPRPQSTGGTLCETLPAVFGGGIKSLHSLLLAQLPAQQLGVLLRSTGTPLSPLSLTLCLTCSSANPAALQSSLRKQVEGNQNKGLTHELFWRGLHMTQHLQSTKQGSISDQTPIKPKASQNHTCSPVKEPLSPERPLIATHICD